MSWFHSLLEKVNWRSLWDVFSESSKKSGGASLLCLGPGLSADSKSPDNRSSVPSSTLLLASSDSSSRAYIYASGIRGDSFVLPSSGVSFFSGYCYCCYYSKSCVYLSYSCAIASFSCSFSSLTLSCVLRFTCDFFRFVPFLNLDGELTLLLLVSPSLEGSLNNPSIFRKSSFTLPLMS